MLPDREAPGSALSLFSGAGGMDLGITRAGFRVRLAIDSDANAAETYQCNQVSATEVWCCDILDVVPSEALAAGGWSRSERPDLVIGAPPAGPFSKSAYWIGWKRHGLDPVHGLIGIFARWVAEVLPAGFILESVPTLASPASPYRSSFLGMLDVFGSAGYKVRCGVLNSAHFGVAQARRRLFVVGRRVTSGGPEGPPPLPFGVPDVSISAKEALSGVSNAPEREEVLSGKWAQLIPSVPPGQNYLYFTEARGNADPVFTARSRYWNFLLKMHPDFPCPTIQARPGPATGPFHWENRRLRVPELKRLFAFPDGFHVVGSRASIQRQIGNAVPPPVSEAIARGLFGPSGNLL